MKTSVARSPLLALALCLSLSFAFASRDVEEVGWRRGERQKEWGKGRSGDGGRPYYFGEESFREWSRTPLGHFKLLERFDDELLRGSVGDYRVACLDVAPRAFLQPSHFDADEVLYVKECEGVLVLLRKGRRDSLRVREGDVMVIPAGSIVYSANTHRSKWLRVVILLNYASFELRRDELERVFERQSKGEIWQASEEQIWELSGSCSRGGGGSGSKEEEIKPTSLPGQKPRYSNNHGRMHTITGDECRHLRDLDMEVSIANITIGSVMAPRYTTHATMIAVVVEGSSYFKMACSHKSDSGQSELAPRARQGGGAAEEESERVQTGDGPDQGGVGDRAPGRLPVTFVSGNEGNLAMVCFGMGSGSDEEVFLADGNSLLKQLDAPAKAIVFGE
ncbi:hypothetical protein ACQ4PT_009505 [Festuca glaucescens]